MSKCKWRYCEAGTAKDFCSKAHAAKHKTRVEKERVRKKASRDNAQAKRETDAAAHAAELANFRKVAFGMRTVRCLAHESEIERVARRFTQDFSKPDPERDMSEAELLEWERTA